MRGAKPSTTRAPIAPAYRGAGIAPAYRGAADPRARWTLSPSHANRSAVISITCEVSWKFQRMRHEKFSAISGCVLGCCSARVLTRPVAGPLGRRSGRRAVGGGSCHLGLCSGRFGSLPTAMRCPPLRIPRCEAEVAETTVRDHVRKRRCELGYGVGDVFVPQVNAPAVTAEVDWGQADAVLVNQAPPDALKTCGAACAAPRGRRSATHRSARDTRRASAPAATPAAAWRAAAATQARLAPCGDALHDARRARAATSPHARDHDGSARTVPLWIPLPASPRSALNEHRSVSRPSDEVGPVQAVVVGPDETVVPSCPRRRQDAQDAWSPSMPRTRLASSSAVALVLRRSVPQAHDAHRRLSPSSSGPLAPAVEHRRGGANVLKRPGHSARRCSSSRQTNSRLTALLLGDRAASSASGQRADAIG
jgi:hypothetical protein